MTRAAKTISKAPTFKKPADFAARRPSVNDLLGTTSPVAFATKGAPKVAPSIPEFLVIPGKSLGPKARIAHYAAGGAAADFVAFSPNDPNLSNMIAGMTEDTRIPVINAISNLLATDEDDSDALNRFRNVLEGLGIGALVPVILKGLSKGISKTGESVSKYVPEETKIAIREKREKYINGPIEKTLQYIADKGHRIAFIDNLARHKNSLTPESMTQLSAWGEFRMLATMKYRQEMAFEKGVEWVNPVSGAVSRISPNHLSMRAIEKIARDLGSDNEELFKSYLWAKQSEQNFRTKRGSQQAKEVYEDILTKVAADKNLQKSYDDIITHMQNYNDDWLEMLRREGKLTAEEVQSYKTARFEDGTTARRIWIPQYRKDTNIDDELLSILNRDKKRVRSGEKHKISSTNIKLKKNKNESDEAFQARLDQQQVDLKKYDEENPYNDPFANLEIAYNAILESAMHNRVKVRLYDTITSLGDAGKLFAEPLEKSIQKDTIHRGALRTALNKEGIGHNIKDPDLTLGGDSTFDVFTKQYKMGPDVDIVWRNGKAEFWKIKDPLLVDSIQSMGHQVISSNVKFAIRFGGTFKNLLTRAVTMAPSFFMGGNFGRDTVGVGMLMKWVPFVDSFRGLYHQFFNTKVAKEFKSGGGSFEKGAYLEVQKGRAYMKDNAERIHTLDGTKGWRKYLDMADNFTQKFEMASRTRAFEIFRKQGFSQQVAAHKAREIAVDFAQHGSSTSFRILTSSVPFLNATIQGIHRTFRALGTKSLVGGKLTSAEKAEAARAWHMTMNLSIVGGVLLPMAHYKSEDEDIRRIYAEIPTYIKDANFVWVMPKFLSETNQLFLIPKPFDFGIIPTVVEKFLDEEYLEYDSNVIREYLWKAFTTMTRADASILPQYIRPFFEIAINEKFTKSPIVPEHLRGTGLAERRYYTSATAIALAELFDNVHILPETFKSPLKVEHLLTSFFGTLGGFTMDYVTDPAFRSFLKMADVPTKAPGSRWPWEEGAKKPGKFGKILPIQIASSTFDNTRSQNEWYKVWTKINNAKSKIDTYDDMADTHSVENWNKHRDDPDNREYWLNHPWAASAMDQLAAINNQIEYVARYDPDNYERRDQLMQQRAEITRTYNDVFLTSQSAIRNTERRRALSMQRSVIGQAHGGLVTGDPVKAFRDSMNMADGGAVWDKVKEGAGKAWDFMTEGAEDAPPPKEPSPIREIGGEIISAINHPLRYAAGKAWEATEDFRRDFDATPGNVGAYLRGIKNSGTTISMDDMNDVDKELLISSIQNRIEETGEKQGKIGYSDFDPEGEIMSFDTDGPIRMLYNSMTDPSYRLQSLFGVANYGVDDEGNPTISDTYNFGGGGSSREDIEAFVQEHGGEFRAIMEGLNQAGFAGLLNVIGNIYVGTDTEGKPYTITLDQENMADGGLVERQNKDMVDQGGITRGWERLSDPKPDDLFTPPVPGPKPFMTRPLQPGEEIPGPEGGNMSEVSITVNEDALNSHRATNIPSLWMIDGVAQLVDQEQAIRLAVEYENVMGVRFPSFDTNQKAIDAAIARSAQGGINAGPLAQDRNDGGLVKRRPQDMSHGGEAAEPIVEGKSYTEEEVIQKEDYNWTYPSGYTLSPGFRGRFSETGKIPINEDPIGMEIYKQIDIPERDDKRSYYDSNLYNKQESFQEIEDYFPTTFNINRYKELLSSAPGFSELMDSIMLQQSILNSMSGMDKEDTDVVVQTYFAEEDRAKGLVRQFIIDNHPVLKDKTGGTTYISPEQINLTLFKAQQFGRNLGQEI